MHLAAALGVPVVGIFGPTDPARNGPFGTRSIVLRSPPATPATAMCPGRMTACLKSAPSRWLPPPGNCWGSVMASWSAIARRVRVPLGFVFAILYFWLARPTVKSILIGAALVIPGLLIRALASGQLQKNEQLATGRPLCLHAQPALSRFADSGDRVCAGLAKLVDRRRNRSSLLCHLSSGDSCRGRYFCESASRSLKIMPARYPACSRE